MKMRYLLLIALLGYGPGNVNATDLMQTYQRALAVDPSFLSAGYAVEAGREKAIQGRALYLPKVTLTSQYSRINSDVQSNSVPPPLNTLLTADSSGNVTEHKLTLSQPIYRAEAWNAAKQLREQSGIAENIYRNAQQDLIIRTAETYFGVLLAQENVRLTEVQKAAVKRQMDSAQARFDAGRAKITDVREAQARYDAILASELSARSDLEVRRAKYFELCGIEAENLADVRADIEPIGPDPNDLPRWQARALQDNLQLKISKQNYTIAEAEIDKYRLLRRPTLDLVGSYSDSRQDGELSPLVAPERSKTSVLAVQLNIPLYAGGQLNSQLRESLAKHQQAQQDVAVAQRDARLQVQQAFLSVTTGAAQITAFKHALASTRLSYEAASLGREVGVRTELDVLNIQQQVYSTQLELSQARYNYLLGMLRLAAAVGDLTPADLVRVNSDLALN